MNLNTQESEKPGIASLIRGIIADAGDLFAKELLAAKLEMREELERTKNAAVLLGIGLGVMVVGSFLLAMMLTYILQAAAGIELWLCYGIVGLVVLVVGAALAFIGKNRVTAVDLRLTETIEGAKEDMRWLKRKVTSGER